MNIQPLGILHICDIQYISVKRNALYFMFMVFLLIKLPEVTSSKTIQITFLLFQIIRMQPHLTSHTGALTTDLHYSGIFSSMASTAKKIMKMKPVFM